VATSIYLIQKFSIVNCLISTLFFFREIGSIYQLPNTDEIIVLIYTITFCKLMCGLLIAVGDHGS